MNKLYEFCLDCGRMGDLTGLFIATEDELRALQGMTIYFGEALGKHSEVSIDDFKFEDHCTVKSDDSEKIDWLIGLLGYTLSGYNPLDYFYIEEQDEYNEGKNSEEGEENPYDATEEQGAHIRWKLGSEDKKNED
ncbi:hypothetical protein [Yersinia phage fHe-Yen9-04]|uniref:Uncharacterized protein n=2 Tax=Eneladusvirus Yen904 TaxID=2560849 RepID=A0A2C9CX94_9CAUD|nr:hypothetical protein FDJ41_gp163 [Yersinia phage fHe-Yen9-04]SOK58440.1 hypothetical protein [Yersinia phage fHe-Yen9-04]SOK58974.1 hypothetical protein [Yersinia phage fHe-Yen9-03]VUE36209.1 hypothetical protein [Yersinia phage fHe-Yen9-04]